jgi:hypothetical protein
MRIGHLGNLGHWPGGLFFCSRKCQEILLTVVCGSDTMELLLNLRVGCDWQPSDRLARNLRPRVEASREEV